jgi:predicted nucleic acid-binding protein
LPLRVLPAVLAADANVLISAVIGGRAMDLLRDPRAPAVMVAPEVCEEVIRHLPKLGSKPGLDPDELLMQFGLLPITVARTELYEAHAADAKQRMAVRDPDDWPSVALALALSIPIWSQDKDMADSGLVVYTTGQLLDALRELPPAGG